ncbi:MAG TPA: TetR/AcrR family transcriptional regulator [Gemmatimonadaceae bacterium]|nr:TetR/AcrR family transcriptional regulator [Gemmatimonadaceae bacterium]
MAPATNAILPVSGNDIGTPPRPLAFILNGDGETYLKTHLEYRKAMSPRPRKASDEEVLAAAQRAMLRLTPAQLTLAEIAAEAGLTAGALVQRFGSKRDLLLWLMERTGDATPAMFDALRARHPSPLAALRAYAGSMAQMGESPAVLAHHLSYLQLDFTDADFHRHARRQAVFTQSALEAMIASAVEVGELSAAVDPATLARLVQSLLGGSLLAWGLLRQGTAADRVERDLEALLEPWMR